MKKLNNEVQLKQSVENVSKDIVDLHDLMRVLGVYVRQSKKDIFFNYEFDTRISYKVEVDRAKIVRILFGLSDDMIKFIGNNSSIDVKITLVERRDKCAVIEFFMSASGAFADSGNNYNASDAESAECCKRYLNSLFLERKYYYLSVKEVIESLYGTIKYEIDPGYWFSFIIKLPFIFV